MTDIQKLKALAEAATPGQWQTEQAYPIVQPAYPARGAICSALIWPDASFIAAANPAAVLELIAELDRVRESHQQVCENYNKVSYASEERGKQIDQLKAENERLQRFETSYKEFSDKTDWVRPNAAAHELGMHVADVIRKRCDDLTSHCQAQADEIVRLRSDAEDGLAVLRTQKQQLECYIKDAGRYRFVRSSNSSGKVDICVLRVRWAAGDQGKEIICDHECDERIDSAMAQEQQP
jgi:hypothetical protein